MIGELAALGAALSWAISAMLYREALLKTKPISANIVRLTCTSAILLMFLVVIGRFGVLTSLSTYAVVVVCASGIIGLGFGDTLYMVSLKLIGVVRAVPITCTYPLFNFLWAAFLIEEPVTVRVVFGAAVIVCGIWLVRQQEETDTDKLQKKIMVKGVAAALATAIIWSVSIAMISIAVKETPDLDHALAINTIRITAIAIAFAASAPIIDRNRGFLKMQTKTLTVLIAGGIVALGIGWFFLTVSFINTLESRAVPISSTTPLFSTLSGIIFLHEKVTAKNVLGSVLIVAGIFLVFIV
jgi:DME family drug/metabolite transporter